MCPLCRGTTKLIRVDGHLSTYQCLDCGEVASAEDGTKLDSYFEWLMSRTKSKRLAAF